MTVFNARYDGKVLVPDEPLDLPANAKVRISIEPIDAESIGVIPIGDARPAATSGSASRKVDVSRLRGAALAGPTNPNPRFPDEDSLWEGTTGNFLENGPNKPKR